ncbi:hypothetical protein M408DRAFT_328728 [Serendipita vermifera MAFF 305830]|uniref:Uncharacterized protein n=1 Tax=Serendipita vermifera MAFF 305830 TaxID=933852 RepID=A0A0C3BDE2_SERVB|nr:hypothetical protein M408DRAFT_328728 [Serendipita vermifera MAFF 305830]
MNSNFANIHSTLVHATDPMTIQCVLKMNILLHHGTIIFDCPKMRRSPIAPISLSPCGPS